MKKRLLTIATCIMLGSLCAFGLSACGDKHEHSYTSVVTNPTCTEQGYTTHTCDCGESYVDTYVEALGHSFTNYVVDANSATYDADGTKTAKCDRCDVTDTITDAGSRLKGTITLVYGNGQQNKVITEYKGTAIPAESDPVREGYTFTGWSIAIPATMGEGSTTITAGWAINQYTITLVYGNGTANKEIKQDYGTAIGAQADPTKTGYTFAGWDKEIPATMPAENLEITAQWNINQYSITVVYGNGTENLVIKKDYNAQITETLPATLNRTGYTFAGWDKEMPATMPVDGLTITANWTINQYEMKFVLGNGEEDVVIKKDYNSAFTAPVPEKVGYTFAGWSATVPETIPAEDLTFTAVWNINQYSIIIVLDNGEENVEIKKDYNAEITETLPADLEKTGYTFAGWDKELPATMPVDGLTITAKWTINQYTITIVYGNGDANTEITQDYNSAITTVLEDPVRNNYIFKGWDKELPATMPVDGLTITAIWVMDVSGEPANVLSAYVSDENDTLVIDALAEYEAGKLADMMIGETVIEKTDYTIVDNKLVFNQNIVTAFLGSYQDMWVIDDLGNLVKVDLLFVNKALATAEDVKQAFDLTAKFGLVGNGMQITSGGTAESNYNSYVLANDIDMTGYTIYNMYAINADIVSDSYFDRDEDGVYELEQLKLPKDLGFGGILDGRGYSISNAVTGALSDYYGFKKSDGTNGVKYNVGQNGFFGRLLAGSIIKNVAFINLNQNGTENARYGLSGPIAIDSQGLIENVYIDINPNCWTARGPIASLGYGHEYRNVVINFPRADYDLATHLAREKNDRYAYGYGALYSAHNSATVDQLKVENVFVASPMPLALCKPSGNGGISTVTKVIYGANEEKLFYDFGGAYAGLTVEEAIALETSAEDFAASKQKNNRLTGVRRYNDLTAMAQDTEAVKSLIETGLFRVSEDGRLIWHSQVGLVVNEDAIEFDAVETFTTNSTLINGLEIKSVKVGDVVLGFEKVNGAYKFTNVPNLEAEENKIFTLTITTEKAIYEFTNVEYKGREIIEVNAAIDYDAAEAKLLTTELDGLEIKSIRTGETALAYADGKLTGVPVVDNTTATGDQVFTIVVETADKVYAFNNVTYWTSVITTQSELKSALDITYSTTEITNNFGFYKLGGNIVVDTATWTEWSYTGIGTKVANDSWNGLTTRGFAGVFDGCGYSIDFNSKGAGSHGLFASLSNGLTNLKNQITVKNVAFLEYQKNWSPVIAKYTKYHDSDLSGNVLLENIYVTWGVQGIQSGIIYEPQSFLTIRNVMVNISNNLQYGTRYANTAEYGNDITNKTLPGDAYYGATLFYTLRRGSTALSQVAESFVSYGAGGLGKTYSFGKNHYRIFDSSTNEDGTYSFTMRKSGWSYTSSEVIPSNPEVYICYAGNQTYGDQPIIAGLKPSFYEVAKHSPLPVYVNASTTNNKLAGYYCATCGDCFALEAGNCTKCEGEVALTASDNLWVLPQAYTWKVRTLSEVDNSTTQRDGEMVFANTYKYDNAAEMKASGNDFASFVGEAGNKMWAVNDGVLTWVGAQA